MRAFSLVASVAVIGTLLTGAVSPQLAFADESNSVVMQYGSTGADVSVLQSDLRHLGYFPRKEGITQYFGPVTAHAVIGFKKDHKLGATDVVTKGVFTIIQHSAQGTAVTPTATTFGERLIARAEKYLGDPYVWGGNSPAGFDCSGFTQYVFAQFGISLPHSAAAQAQMGTPVSEADLQPGDLVFFNTSGGISHVGIYIGGGQFINAASTDVEIDNIHDPYYWSSRYVGACRITGNS
ncbi:MAG: NlpC/P60 family protein [Firmicutes bacterium]|nr:NlpC/P60 family protein [Bacillota bacterium]